MPVITKYHIPATGLTKPVKLAIISDLHNESFEQLLPLVKGCDALLVPGDVSNRYSRKFSRGIDFLREAAALLPTFYSVGNHELRLRNFQDFLQEAEKTGAELLINRFVSFQEIVIGGWYPPSDLLPENNMLDELEAQPGFKLLMCHKPNHAVESLLDRNVDLIVSGHAHGGQIQFRGQGVYAPGQGLFPKYTKGIYHQKLLVTAGVGNPCCMPRWNNPREIVLLTIG